MKDWRKVIAGGLGLAALESGLWLCLKFPTGSVVFPPYATAAVTIVGLMIAGNIGEWAAKRGQP